MATFAMKFGETVYQLATSFKAVQMIEERVGDPFIIAQDEARRADAYEKGLPDPGGFRMSVGSMVNIIHSGLQANGDNTSVDEIGEVIVRFGVIQATEPVGEYLAILVGGEEQPKNRKQRRAENSGKGGRKGKG